MKITANIIDSANKEAPRYFHGRRLPRTWIMVIDRKKAHIFSKRGSDLTLVADAKPDVDDEGPDLSNIDPREGQKRHEEIYFARGLSAWLDEAHQQERFDDLVLVAAPRMLGTIRAALSDTMGSLIIGQIAKDLTNIPVPEIKRHLANVVYFRD